MKYDAIVVLGAGPTKKETNPEAKARLDVARSLFNKKVADKIIVSGGFTKTKIRISEASAMKKYLISTGVDENVVIKEEKSKDTIGNALFTKNLILKPRKWKKILVVTTEYHVRAKYVFRKVLGKDYTIKFIMIPLGFYHPIYRLFDIEGKLYELTKIFFRGIRPGDDKEVKRRMFSIHPSYISNKKLETFAKLSNEELAKLSNMSPKTITRYKHNPIFIFYLVFRLNNGLKLLLSGVAGI